MWQVVYKKELWELLRDKKTMMFMVLLPLVLFPLMFGAVAFFAAKTIQTEQQRELVYYIVNADSYVPAAARFADAEGFERYENVDADITIDSLRQLIRDNKIDFVLELPEQFSELEAEQQSEWVLHFNDAQAASFIWSRVTEQIASINQVLTETRLVALGAKSSQVQALVKPVVIKKNDIAELQEAFGAKLGGLIPYLILPLCLMGAMYPAIDLAAGEKEKGTMEALLIAPLSGFELVMGKFLTIATTSLMTAMMTLFSLAIWALIFGHGFAVQAVQEVIGTIGIGVVLQALAMLIPVVVLFAALVLSISVYARSFKEAQNYMAPLSFLVFVPLMVAMLPGINLNWQWAFIPIANVALAIKDILKGQADTVLLMAVWGMQAGLAVIMLSFCAYWFKRESVLFR